MHVWYDARNRAILRGRFPSDERLSALGERGSLDEIKLPSRAAVLVAVNELPIDLAVEIDFRRVRGLRDALGWLRLRVRYAVGSLMVCDVELRGERTALPSRCTGGR